MTVSSTQRPWSKACLSSALHIRRKVKSPGWAEVHAQRRRSE